MLEGRSSTGRLGLFIHVTAGFGDVGFAGYWTLEIFCVQPIRIYPNVEVCQSITTIFMESMTVIRVENIKITKESVQYAVQRFFKIGISNIEDTKNEDTFGRKKMHQIFVYGTLLKGDVQIMSISAAQRTHPSKKPM